MILVVHTCSALGAENINKVRNPGCKEDNGGKDREKQQSSKEKVAVKWLWNGRRNGRGNCTKTKLKENQFKIGLCRFAYRIEGYYTIHFDKTFSTILKTITYFECCQTDWRLLCIIYMLSSRKGTYDFWIIWRFSINHVVYVNKQWKFISNFHTAWKQLPWI